MFVIKFKDVNTLVIILGINSDYQGWVKKDATTTFKTQGVLGDKFLEINGGSDASPSVREGDYLLSIESTQLEHIVNKSEDLMVTAGHIFAKLDKILSSIESNRVEKIILNLDSLMANANKSMSSLNDKNLTQSVANFKRTSESIGKITVTSQVSSKSMVRA